MRSMWRRTTSRRALSSLGAAVAVLALAAGPVPAATPAQVLWERNLVPGIADLAYPYNHAFDPIVATDPLNPDRLAVAYHFYQTNRKPCGVSSPGLRVSHDGGETWQTAAKKPWGSSGRKPNWHATITWGPGPTAGSTRLYWADTTTSTCSYTDHRLSVAYTDDFGATWSPLFTYTGTPATRGGYPDITVDRNPASPNYGVVYATINWFSSSGNEPGMRVLASRNYGRTWTAVEVPPLAGPTGYPFAYRIGYRLRTAPGGGLYASFCQTDRTSSTGAIGRLAYGVARLGYNRSTGKFTRRAPVLATTLALNAYNLGNAYAPGTSDRTRLGACWSHGLEVDDQGRPYLALGNYRANGPADEPRGVIKLGTSDDKGLTWTWQQLPGLAPVDGRQQSAHKPALAMRGATVFVGFHVLSDFPIGSPATTEATIGNAYTVSYDRGANWTTPAAISPARWSPEWLDPARQRAGLRDRAEMTADGRVFYAYGDGRDAAAKPDPRWGRGQIYGTLISPGSP